MNKIENKMPTLTFKLTTAATQGEGSASSELNQQLLIALVGRLRAKCALTALRLCAAQARAVSLLLQRAGGWHVCEFVGGHLIPCSQILRFVSSGCALHSRAQRRCCRYSVWVGGACVSVIGSVCLAARFCASCSQAVYCTCVAMLLPSSLSCLSVAWGC